MGVVEKVLTEMHVAKIAGFFLQSDVQMRARIIANKNGGEAWFLVHVEHCGADFFDNFFA